MSEPTNAILKAVYTRLTSALSPIKAYDSVPQGAAYPYVVIESLVGVQSDFVSSRKDEFFVYLSVWSQYKGQKQVADIIGDICDALHRTQLPMDTGRMVECTVREKRTIRDADNLTFQGSVKLRIMAEH